MSSRFLSNGLADLASNNQQRRDAALLRATTELFVQESAHDRDEIRRYEELASHFLPKVAISDRIFVAERLATRIDAPQSIIGMLAKDVIEVAEPVIRRSPVLKPLDLLAVIAATGVEHHRLVARRPGVGEDVERALRLTGDPDVLAQLGQTKFLSQGNSAVATPVATTSRKLDPAERRPQNMQSSGPSRDAWQFMSLDSIGRLRVMANLATAEPGRTGSPTRGRLDRAFRTILGAAQIVGLARSGKGNSLVDAITDGLDVEATFVRAALEDPSGEPLAVLLKALSLDCTQAQQVFLLASRTVGRDVHAFFRISDIYAGMESFVAEALVAGWRTKTQTEAARHQPLFSEDGSSSRQRPSAEIRREHPATPAQRSETA